MTIHISLWSSPRNISTALMYSFAQRQDTKVVDEPLYAHYLSHSKAKDYHPGASEILASQEQDGEKVVREQLLGAYDVPVVFFKNMTHHLIELEWGFLALLKNVILTREPKGMLLSYSQQISQPSLSDTGYAAQLKLVQYLEALGQEVIIVDSADILRQPREMLGLLCERLGIVFDEKMLSWQAGARAEDGVWAKYWYANVHASSGFSPYQERDLELPLELQKLYEQCLPYYQTLKAKCLRPQTSS
ncbi:MAG: hypothetical protein R2880_19455 [Deinococcales bacterium]